MIRRLLNLLAVLSLAACVSVLALWARSDRVRDARAFHWHGSAYALFSDRGCVGVDNTPAVEAFQAAQRRRIEALLDEERRLMSYLATKDDEGPRTMYIANQKYAARAILTQTPPALVTHSISYLALPPALMIFPAAWALRYRRRLLRMTRGLCAECGYDLRGTPSRCPECGKIAAASLNR